MTTKFVDMDIRQDEGFRAEAYPDPLTGGDPWTVGFGCTGAGIIKGTRWTLAQAVQEQMKRRQANEVALDRAIPWWRQLSDERQDVLCNMAYQLGAAADAIGGLLNVFENVAEGVITTAVAQHLGPAAAALEYDFLHALITKAQARQTAITLPTPALITPPAQPAAVETQT